MSRSATIDGTGLSATRARMVRANVTGSSPALSRRVALRMIVRRPIHPGSGGVPRTARVSKACRKRRRAKPVALRRVVEVYSFTLTRILLPFTFTSDPAFRSVRTFIGCLLSSPGRARTLENIQNR
jgi:hypothetical protein